MASPPKSHQTTAFKGALLSVGMRWTDRLLGLISTLILARLLLPADFGLVAMAMVVVGLIDVLLDLGVSAALIQNTTADDADYDTAWTVRLCQAIVAAAILAAGAPLVAEYYNDARVTDILRVIAFTVFVGGLENIGIVSFQKNMEFGRDFQFFFLKRIVGVAFTITAALLLRSYWALVLGSLVSRLAGVGISYWMSPHRPRLSLARFSGMWSFSQWNLVAGIGAYLYTRLDKFVIGRRADAAVLGAYALGDEIAAMPTTELLAPLGRVMFPAFALVRDDKVEFTRIVTTALAVQALIAIPAGVGVFLVADDAIPLLFGSNWVSAVPFAQVIALASVAAALGHSSMYMLLSLGRIKTLSLYHWGQFLLLLLLVVGVFPRAHAYTIALARLGVAFVGLLALQVMARRALPSLGNARVVGQIWRPLVSSLIMASAVMAVSTTLVGGGLLRVLAIKVLLGATVYVLSLFLLWRTAGSPSGGETYVLEKLGVGRVTKRN